MTLRPQTRFDGALTNLLTGLGTSIDPRRSTTIVPQRSLTEQEIDDLVLHYWEAQKFVETLPEEALRKWITLNVEGGPDDAAKLILDDLEEKQVRQHLRKALVYERQYGGSCIVLGVSDAESAATPLDPESIEEGGFKFVETYSRHRVMEPGAGQLVEDRGDPRYGLPEHYLIRLDDIGDYREVHHSRVIVFQGWSPKERERRYDWGESVLNRFWPTLRDYETAVGHGVAIGSRLVETRLYISGLVEMLMGNQEARDKARAMLQEIAAGRSTFRIMMVDATHKVEDAVIPMGGYAELIGITRDNLAAASGLSAQRFFGLQQQGLSNNDESGSERDDAVIAAYQRDQLLPALNRIVELSVASLGLGVDTWQVKFVPLREETPSGRAQRQQVEATTAQLYAGIRAVHPEEVRETLRADPDNAYQLEEGSIEEAFPPPEPGAPGGPPLPGAPAPGKPPIPGPGRPPEVPRGDVADSTLFAAWQAVYPDESEAYADAEDEIDWSDDVSLYRSLAAVDQQRAYGAFRTAWLIRDYLSDQDRSDAPLGAATSTSSLFRNPSVARLIAAARNREDPKSERVLKGLRSAARLAARSEAVKKLFRDREVDTPTGSRRFVWQHNYQGPNPRLEHVARDGEIYSWDDMPGEGEAPGEWSGCQCSAAPYEDDDDRSDQADETDFIALWSAIDPVHAAMFEQYLVDQPYPETAGDLFDALVAAAPRALYREPEWEAWRESRIGARVEEYVFEEVLERAWEAWDHLRDGSPGADHLQDRGRQDAFNPDQPRDENGRWTSTGGAGSGRSRASRARGTAAAKRKVEGARAVRSARLTEIKRQIAERQKERDRKKQEARQRLEDLAKKRAERAAKKKEPAKKKAEKKAERQQEEQAKEAERQQEEQRSPEKKRALDAYAQADLPDDERLTGAYSEQGLKSNLQNLSDGKSQLNATRQVNELLTDYGLVNRDVVEKRLLGGAIGIKPNEKMPNGANAYHDWNGEIVLSEDVAAGVQRWARGSERLEDADDVRILTHESLHGASPMTKSSYTDQGAVIEEVTTEVMARKIVRERILTDAQREKIRGTELFQANQLGGAYQPSINKVRVALREFSGDRSESGLNALIETASQVYKDGAGTPVNTPQQASARFARAVMVAAGRDPSEAPRLQVKLDTLRIDY